METLNQYRTALEAIARMHKYGEGPDEIAPDGEDAMRVLNYHIDQARKITRSAPDVCAGLADPAKEIAALKEQRTALLVALEGIIANDDISRNDWCEDTMDVLHAAVAAIEKAEGRAEA